jgi:hypothetical protein
MLPHEDPQLRWSEGARLRPMDYFQLGELSALVPRALELAGGSGRPDLSDLDPTPAELATLDQVLAEVDEGTWDDLELDALEAEMDDLRYGPDLSQVSQAMELAGEQASQQRIAGGEWQPDQALPTVAALAEQYQVSPEVVHRVLRRLADEGLVRIVPRWGTFRA